MDNLELNKDERRRILGSLEDWNMGITTQGKLAPESCFVHNAVPDILYANNDLFQATFLSTRSEWSANLVQSNTLNPCDTETVKSLSVCKAIFHPESVTSTANIIHLINHNLKACVMVNNIARLTKDFEDELTKAEEHWPHSPQKSWDQLCYIWNKYGFLWPQKVEIGFKTHHFLVNKSNLDIETIKQILLKESQDVQNIPKSYSVIWRTNLKPVHEFFPAHYDKKRNFINDIIRKFSNVVFSDSLFRLKNVKSGDYLVGQTKTLEITTLSSSSSDTKLLNKSNLYWKFDDESTESPSYIFNHDKKPLYSGQLDAAQTSLLSRSQHNQSDRNNNNNNNNTTNTAQQACDNIKLIQPSQQAIPYDSSNDFLWSIDVPTTTKNDYSIDLFDLDNSIQDIRCLVHNDRITLNQDLFYLKSAPKDSIYKSESIRILISPGSHQQQEETKSPLSIMSFGDQYNFSSCESNHTQPTSGSNSFHSSGSVPNSNSKNNYRDDTLQQHTSTIACIEQLRHKVNTSTEYCWTLEMVSKTMINQTHRDRMNVVVKSLSKSNISEDQTSSPIINKRLSYHPDLNYNLSPIPTNNDIQNRMNEQTKDLTGTENDVYISSFIPIQDHAESTKKPVKKGSHFWNTKPQKSKWLNVDPKLYNLNPTQEEDDEEEEEEEEIVGGSFLSAYSAVATESIRSLPSTSHSYVSPEISSKRYGKQPLQKTTTMYENDYNYPSSHSDPWSSPESASSPVDKNTDVESTPAGEQQQNESSPAVLTEAESVKRIYQESHNSKEKEVDAYNILVQKMLSTPTSNNTSQIQYYDEDDGSSQVRTYTMTPYSRFSQQQMTPGSSANLSPEEYARRKKSRENSFMLLIDRETKQEFCLRTVKESSLSNWIHFLSKNTKKLSGLYQKASKKKNHLDTTSSKNNRINNNSNSNRVIQKKKGFYLKRNGNLQQQGIVI